MKIEDGCEQQAPPCLGAPMPGEGWFCEAGVYHWVELAVEKDGEDVGHYTNTCDNRAWLLVRSEVSLAAQLRNACFNCIKLLQASARGRELVVSNNVRAD